MDADSCDGRGGEGYTMARWMDGMAISDTNGWDTPKESQESVSNILSIFHGSTGKLFWETAANNIWHWTLRILVINVEGYQR